MPDGGRLRCLQIVGERPSGARGVLDDEHARLGVFVPGGVGALLPLFGFLDDEAIRRRNGPW